MVEPDKKLTIGLQEGAKKERLASRSFLGSGYTVSDASKQQNLVMVKL